MLASSTTWSHLHARSPCVFHEFRIAGERPPAPSIFATTPGKGARPKWHAGGQIFLVHCPFSPRIDFASCANASRKSCAGGVSTASERTMEWTVTCGSLSLIGKAISSKCGACNSKNRRGKMPIRLLRGKRVNSVEKDWHSTAIEGTRSPSEANGRRTGSPNPPGGPVSIHGASTSLLSRLARDKGCDLCATMTTSFSNRGTVDRSASPESCGSGRKARSTSPRRT